MNKQKYFEESLPEEYVLVKHIDAKNINRQAVVYALFFDRGKLHGTQTRDLALFCFHDHPVFLYRLCLLYQRFLRLERLLYSYILIDYLFVLLQKHKRTRSNIIAGAVMLGLIYFAT